MLNDSWFFYSRRRSCAISRRFTSVVNSNRRSVVTNPETEVQNVTSVVLASSSKDKSRNFVANCTVTEVKAAKMAPWLLFPLFNCP